MVVVCRGGSLDLSCSDDPMVLGSDLELVDSESIDPIVSSSDNLKFIWLLH
jgi:hypothetical protein